MTRTRSSRGTIEALGHARIERAPKRARKLGSAFWTARELPDFGKLPSLVSLSMYRSVDPPRLVELFERVATSATLEQLALIDCAIDALPDDLSALSRLFALRIEGGRLSTLPSSIGALDRLEDLSIIRNPILELPDEVGTMAALRWLRVGGTGYAPSSLRRFPQLDGATELAKLGIMHVPELEDVSFLTRVPSLRALELQGRVTAQGVPEEIGSLAHLRALAIADVPEVPSFIARLRSLECLYLVNGACSRVPSWLPELTSLRYLALFGNRDLDHASIVEAATSMPGLSSLFLPYPCDASTRNELKRLGFVTDRSNPSRMDRGERARDDFPFIR